MTTKTEEGRAIVALEDGLVYADEAQAALATQAAQQPVPAEDQKDSQ